MKDTLKRVITVIAFIGIVLFTYEVVSDQFCRSNSVYIRINQVLKTPKDTLDVLFVGSSHVHQAVYPVEMYERYGYTSGLISSTAQSIPCSYYILEEVLKNQHPKVVVLDAFGITKNTYATSQSWIRVLTDAMPTFSDTRIRMIHDLSQKADKGEDAPWTFYYKLGYHHGRWDEMDYAKIKKKESDIACARGSMVYFDVVDSVKSFRMSDEKSAIPPIPKPYLEKIKNLCDDKGVELVIVSIPYSSEKDKYGETEEEMKALKGVSEYCNTNEIPFLCFMDDSIPLTIDYNNDFHDTGHLNYYGGEKVTEYLGSWLDENYDLPDHRNDPNYNDWNLDILRYKEYLHEMETSDEEISE